MKPGSGYLCTSKRKGSTKAVQGQPSCYKCAVLYILGTQGALVWETRRYQVNPVTTKQQIRRNLAIMCWQNTQANYPEVH